MSQRLPRFHSMTTLLTIKQVAAYTGLSIHTLYGMVSQKRIPYVKVGRLLRFDQRLLEDWLKKHTVMPMLSVKAKQYEQTGRACN